jgi:NAD kinase
MVADFHGIQKDGRYLVAVKVNVMALVKIHPISNVSRVLVLKSGFLMKTFKEKMKV